MARPVTGVRSQPEPGDAVMDFVGLGSLAVLLLNDCWLKPHFRSALTGKLSDVAGLVLLPLLLAAGIEVVSAVFGRPWGLSQSTTLGVVVAVGIGFTVVKSTSWGAHAFGVTAGRGWWCSQWPSHVLLRRRVPAYRREAILVDGTDLLALPALGIAYWALALRAGTTAPPGH